MGDAAGIQPSGLSTSDSSVDAARYYLAPACLFDLCLRLVSSVAESSDRSVAGSTGAILHEASWRKRTAGRVGCINPRDFFHFQCGDYGRWKIDLCSYA